MSSHTSFTSIFGLQLLHQGLLNDRREQSSHLIQLVEPEDLVRAMGLPQLFYRHVSRPVRRVPLLLARPLRLRTKSANLCNQAAQLAAAPRHPGSLLLTPLADLRGTTAAARRWSVGSGGRGKPPSAAGHPSTMPAVAVASAPRPAPPPRPWPASCSRT